MHEAERRGFRPKTWHYSWDVLDRLVTCTTPEGEVWHYRYDPFGRRLTKVRQFTDIERAWVSQKHPGLVPEALRPQTVDRRRRMTLRKTDVIHYGS